MVASSPHCFTGKGASHVCFRRDPTGIRDGRSFPDDDFLGVSVVRTVAVPFRAPARTRIAPQRARPVAVPTLGRSGLCVGFAKQDISTLLGIGHFYFAPTVVHNRLVPGRAGRSNPGYAKTRSF